MGHYKFQALALIMVSQCSQVLSSHISAQLLFRFMCGALGTAYRVTNSKTTWQTKREAPQKNISARFAKCDQVIVLMVLVV